MGSSGINAGVRKVKFGSKRAIFGVIWEGFEGFGPCLGVSHPTHPHLGEISQKKNGFFLAAPLREALTKKKMFSFGHCPNYLSPPLPPQFGQLVPLFLDVKNDVLARITEQSKDDYDNGVSDNCDQNFGTFDDFGVKNDQKVSHNMILMSTSGQLPARRLWLR